MTRIPPALFTRLSARALFDRKGTNRRSGSWRLLVPAMALLAGLLAATTAHTARGTDLRSAGRSNVADLVRQAEARAGADEATVKQLQSQVAALTNKRAQSDNGISVIKSAADKLSLPAGLVAVSGPGITLTLDDAHPSQPETDPEKANAEVVHQSDMQAAVNAMWAGGAEAIVVMGQRVVATSAVRCVGSTLLLNGRVFSPPFSIGAIGPVDSMRAALDQSSGLRQYRKDASSYGLGYELNTKSKISAPAYDAPVTLSYATVGR